MIAERTAQKAISITLKSGKISIKVLLALIHGLIRNANAPKHGKQSIKNLNKHNTALSSMEFESVQIKQLCSDLKKYGVDFSVMKDKTTGGVVVWFKGRDAEQIHSALKDYIADKLKQSKDKTSIHNTVQDIQKQTQNQSNKIAFPLKHKVRSGESL